MRRGRSRSRTALVAAPSSGSEDSEWEEERVERLRERAWRAGPRGPGSGGKGRSRRSREQRTNWRVPAGHERKITAKIRASLAKRRLQQRPGRGPRSAPLQPRKSAGGAAKGFDCICNNCKVLALINTQVSKNPIRDLSRGFRFQKWSAAEHLSHDL